jgi:hypothetical protein
MPVQYGTVSTAAAESSETLSPLPVIPLYPVRQSEDNLILFGK